MTASWSDSFILSLQEVVTCFKTHSWVTLGRTHYNSEVGRYGSRWQRTRFSDLDQIQRCGPDLMNQTIIRRGAHQGHNSWRKKIGRLCTLPGLRKNYLKPPCTWSGGDNSNVIQHIVHKNTCLIQGNIHGFHHREKDNDRLRPWVPGHANSLASLDVWEGFGYIELQDNGKKKFGKSLSRITGGI